MPVEAEDGGGGGGSPQGHQPSDGARSSSFRSGAPKKPLVLKLWELLQPLARFWGLITAIVMSGAGAELLVLGYHIAPGIIAGAACILILETMWVAALFVDLICRRGEYTMGLRTWDLYRWCCGRARAPMYACGATALLFADLTLLTTLSGAFLMILAALRALVPFSPYATHGPHSPRAGSSLLSQLDPPLPDVFYNSANSVDDRSEEMTVLGKKESHSRSVSPKPPLLQI